MTQTPEQFFAEHAGYSYDPKTETPEQGKARCAHDLAKAEIYAELKGWTYVWEIDPDDCIGCECGGADCPCETKVNHEPYYAQLWDGDNILGSLGSVCNPTPEYRRVINAELALEAMP